MQGARAIIARGQQTPWIERLLARRPYSVVVAAVANNLARTAWAILNRGKPFEIMRWNPTETSGA